MMFISPPDLTYLHATTLTFSSLFATRRQGIYNKLALLLEHFGALFPPTVPITVSTIASTKQKLTFPQKLFPKNKQLHTHSETRLSSAYSPASRKLTSPLFTYICLTSQSTRLYQYYRLLPVSTSLRLASFLHRT
jgi:hypothetical protein